MFKYFKLAALTALLLPCAVKAQTCIYDAGTKTLYQAPHVKNTPPPAGYQPVFINYVGRHGARHLTKQVNTSYAFTLLSHADSLQQLTTAGKQLLAMVKALDKVERNEVKSISQEGREELQGIGKRLYTNNPIVFTGKPKLEVSYTKEIRTKQSANAFLSGLKVGFKDSAIITERTDDTNLRFYDSSPVYTAFEENGSWLAVMNKLKRSLLIAEMYRQIAARWLTPAAAEILTPAEDEKLVADVFGFAGIVPSVKNETSAAGYNVAAVDFNSLFTCPELASLSKLDNAEDYLKKGPGTNVNGIQVKIAAPLLADFINTADEFIKGSTVNANLRFAHAETIAPFAALLDIAVASKQVTDMLRLTDSWRSSAVAPLSSNIQWIFYRKKNSNDLLVKVLLNEKAARIGNLPALAPGYYKWRALRAYYLTKLKSLDVQLTDNMADYLER